MRHDDFDDKNVPKWWIAAMVIWVLAIMITSTFAILFFIAWGIVSAITL